MSHSLVRIASDHAVRSGFDIEFRPGDAVSMPFPDNSSLNRVRHSRPHAAFHRTVFMFSPVRYFPPQGSCYDMPMSIGFLTAPPLSAQSL